MPLVALGCVIVMVTGLVLRGRSLNRHILDTVVSLEFTDAGVRAATENATTDWRWRGFIHLTRLRRHIVLHLNPRLAVIVPRRAFGSNEAFDAFAEYAGRRVVQ